MQEPSPSTTIAILPRPTAGTWREAAWQHFTFKASAAWRGDQAPTSDSDRHPRVWVSGNYSF
jgi:hypothetical protein